jgi:sterigmatocystin biosynthesis cytochrome P450 monooxygenase
VPYTVDCTLTFLDQLKEKARTNELFILEQRTDRFTLDVIGKVVLDADFTCQTRDHPLAQAFFDRSPLMYNSSATVTIFRDLEFVRRFKLWRNGLELDRLMGQEVDRAIGRRGTTTPGKSFKDRKRSIVDLACDAYVKEQMQNTSGDIKPSAAMDDTFRSDLITQCKTMLFAGHDTTSSTVQYIFYLLHHHPQVHAKIITELHSIFGPDIAAPTIAARLRAETHLLNSLPYITAVIKETLRIFPPASTLRVTRPSDGPLSIPNSDPTARPIPLANCTIWPVAHMIHRNEAYFPEPERFVPERFMPDQTPYPKSLLFTEPGKEAFRAFERGPRSCIGEQVAMIELKSAVALCVPTLDFVAEVDGHVAKCSTGRVRTVEDSAVFEERVRRGEVKPRSELGRTVEGFEIYQCLKGTAKATKGMPGRMYFR